MFNLFFLLQVDSTGMAVHTAATDKGVSLIELLTLGGWIMIPLTALFLITIFVFFERFLSIRKASSIEGNFMNIIRDHIVNGNVTAARSFAKNTNNPVARIIDKRIQRIGKPIENIERSMENVGKLEVYNMERNLSILSLIAGIAPLLGFLGTIDGDATHVALRVVQQRTAQQRGLRRGRCRRLCLGCNRGWSRRPQPENRRMEDLRPQQLGHARAMGLLGRTRQGRHLFRCLGQWHHRTRPARGLVQGIPRSGPRFSLRPCA